jgi:hypothetical protein
MIPPTVQIESEVEWLWLRPMAWLVAEAGIANYEGSALSDSEATDHQQ